jgi:hypothetical protein
MNYYAYMDANDAAKLPKGMEGAEDEKKFYTVVLSECVKQSANSQPFYKIMFWKEERL